jgi:hypothetical protein
MTQAQNNNQSADQDTRREESKGIVKKAYQQPNFHVSSAVQVANNNNEEVKGESQNGQSTDQRFKENTNSENSDDELSGDDDDSHDSQVFNDDYRDSQDSQDEVSQESNDISNINQRIPGAGSGN